MANTQKAREASGNTGTWRKSGEERRKVGSENDQGKERNRARKARPQTGGGSSSWASPNTENPEPVWPQTSKFGRIRQHGVWGGQVTRPGNGDGWRSKHGTKWRIPTSWVQLSIFPRTVVPNTTSFGVDDPHLVRDGFFVSSYRPESCTLFVIPKSAEQSLFHYGSYMEKPVL